MPGGARSLIGIEGQPRRSGSALVIVRGGSPIRIAVRPVTLARIGRPQIKSPNRWAAGATPPWLMPRPAAPGNARAGFLLVWSSKYREQQDKQRGPYAEGRERHLPMTANAPPGRMCRVFQSGASLSTAPVTVMPAVLAARAVREARSTDA